MPDLPLACGACHDAAGAEGRDRYEGKPGIVDEPSALWVDRAPREPLPHGPLADLRPQLGGDRDVWIALTHDGELLRLDLDRRTVAPLARISPALLERTDDRPDPLRLHVARDARLAAVVQRRGRGGAVVDLETGRTTMELSRGDYHEEHCEYPCAFVQRAGRTLLVHGTDWNRLDVSDARTGELLTVRESPVYARDERPAHYLDYFHCGLLVSPDQRSICEHGWVWHPYGVVIAWSLDAWLDTNVWESEDGPTRRSLAAAAYFWDGPMCWLDGTRLATWGLGEDDPLLPAIRVFDVPSEREIDWFPGPPAGDLVFDGGVLVSLAGDAGTTAWDVDRGTRLLHDAHPAATRFHPTAKTFVAFDRPGLVTARLCGHQARWHDGVVADLAAAIARDRTFADLPVLGDALERAGCTDAELLAHCQQPGDHGDRCWAIDRLLSRPRG
ncbi:MAG: hypothetical protein KF773_28295 [Deltaproteobacteria bacterium]|nr:hypothetical protein [Deltaproteobacteria bacterium]